MPEMTGLSEPPACKEALMLAADTSTRHCAIALCRCSLVSGRCEPLASAGTDRHRLHAERLLDSVHWVLGESGYALNQISCLAISTGPGSFTGLRVGLAAWKGLAFALKLPLLSVSTLDALSRLNTISDGIVIPLLDARMNEVFGAVYEFHKGRRVKQTPDRVCVVEDFLVGDVARHPFPVFLGDGALKYRDVILGHLPNAVIAPDHCGIPRAEAVAAEALESWMNGACSSAANAVPRYLRASQAEQAREARETAIPAKRS